MDGCGRAVGEAGKLGNECLGRGGRGVSPGGRVQRADDAMTIVNREVRMRIPAWREVMRGPYGRAMVGQRSHECGMGGSGHAGESPEWQEARPGRMTRIGQDQRPRCNQEASKGLEKPRRCSNREAKPWSWSGVVIGSKLGVEQESPLVRQERRESEMLSLSGGVVTVS